MNLFIASDIHGSVYYCKKLLEAFEKEGCDKMLLLGDILYHGPRNDLPRDYAPKQVIAMLNALKDKILCVRGNCDTEVDQMVLEFPILADYAVIYNGSQTVYATHGHVYNEERLPPIQNGDVLLHGHTHVSACIDREEYVYMNPGSVSIPKEDTPRGYMLMNDAGAVWKTLDGEIYKNYDFRKEQDS